MRFLPVIFVLALVFGVSQAVQAQVVGDSVYSFVTDQTSYTTTPGGLVAVEVFLQEDFSAQSGDGSFINSEGGMLSANAEVTLTLDGGATIDSATVNDTDFDLSAVFNIAPSSMGHPIPRSLRRPPAMRS